MTNELEAKATAARVMANAERHLVAIRSPSTAPGHGNGTSNSSATEKPLPLAREVPPPEPFPIDALGGLLGNAAEGIADRIKSPLAMCAQSVLAAANLAVQAHADIELPIGAGRPKPISNGFICVAVSGERKTASDAEACEAIKARAKVLRDNYSSEEWTYQKQQDAWDAERKEIIGKAKGNQAKIMGGLDHLGPPPKKPLQPFLTCEEPTYEGLFKLLQIGQPSVGVFSNEGGQFIGGHGMSDDAKLRTAAGMSKFWDSEPVHRVRGGDGAATLAGRRVAMHLMVQPGVADIFLQDPLLADQGLLSRLLVTYPQSTIGTRQSGSEHPSTAPNLDRYTKRLTAILQRPYPLAPNTQNELVPRAIGFSPQAAAGWRIFVDHIESQLGSELEPVRCPRPASGRPRALPHARRSCWRAEAPRPR
jgi:hypothetical protein